MKIRPVGAELFHAVEQTDRRKDMMKLIVAFRSFVKAPNKTDGQHSAKLSSVRGKLPDLSVLTSILCS